MNKNKDLMQLLESSYRKQIEDSFNLYIQTPDKYSYNFKNERITAEGCGYYAEDFPEKDGHRFYLELSIRENSKGKTLAAIMMNPSNTFPAQKNKPSTIDNTVKNVIRMAYKLGKYNKAIILNSFLLISGTVEKRKAEDAIHTENLKFHKENLKIIKTFIKENKNIDYLLAWGSKALYTDKIKDYLKNENVSNIFVYKLSKTGYPCHPSRVVENRYKYVSDFLISHDNNSSFEKFIV